MSDEFDVAYFTKKLEIVLRDVKMYAPDEMARELIRLGRTADSAVLSEPEFARADLAPAEPGEDAKPLPFDSDKRPQRGFWAPGYYSCKCMKCGREYTGDKRSKECSDCAYSDPTTGEDSHE